MAFPHNFRSGQTLTAQQMNEIEAEIQKKADAGSTGGTSSGGYTKPSGGIPKSDLSYSVQASLNRADTLTDAYIKNLVPSSGSGSSGSSITIDTTLTKSGQGADAKVVGDKINELKEDLNDLETEVENAKKSASDGKVLLANAITQKGINTASTATFAQMANNIKSISSGGITVPSLGYAEIYVTDGETGEVADYNAASVVCQLDDGNHIFTDSNNNIKMFGFNNSGKMQVIDKTFGQAILTIPSSKFGDALASDVAEGKTFTSADGYKVVGTAKVGSDELLPSADIPSYVREEAMAVAEKVRAVQNSNTITCITMSDAHHYGSQNDSYASQANVSNLHAMQGAKILAYALNVDFMAYCGDYTAGTSTSTVEQIKEHIKSIQDWIDEDFKGIPVFQTIGNHDTGEYSTLLDSSYIMDEIMKADGAVYGSESIGKPYYVDIASKKLRVISINSVQTEMKDHTSDTLTAQATWFANALYDVGNKSDWKIIVISHYPLDMGGTKEIGNVLYSYKTGGTANGVNFSGRNLARFLCQFHGHTHCFKVAKLNRIVISNGAWTPTEFDCKRVAIPNMSYYRSNSYKDLEVYGVRFGEDTTYDKTANTGKDTAFTVNVIDTVNLVIHSFCYGAGIDRVISIGDTVYRSISNNLTNVTTNNSATSIEDGTSYSATLTVASNHELASITVTMGGTNITASAVSGNKITIAKVTGDIVITAIANAVASYTNQIPISVASGGGSVYNGTGYQNAKRIGSGGTESNNAPTFVTGFIPVSEGDVIRLGGDGITFNEYGCMLFAYNDSFSPMAGSDYQRLGNATFGFSTADTGSLFKWSPIATNQKGCAYIRISAKGDGANAIVTKNEQIV